MKSLLNTVFGGKGLDRKEAAHAMTLMLAGEAKPEQTAAFLAAIHVRGETAQELAGFLDVLRREALPFPVAGSGLFDNCGTGGDGAQTFNISTACAFVLAGAGGKVAKHGNRSVSSRAGSADVLEALGVVIDHSPQTSASAIGDFGFGFLFAPQYHPALAKLAPLRRALEVRTVLNVLGPLVNPAHVDRQIIGVFDPKWISRFAELLREMGTREAMIVASEDGLDELSLGAPANVAHLKNGAIRTLKLSASDFGLARAPREELKGGDAAENALIIEAILSGREKGAKRDVVLMNAAAGLLVAGIVDNLRDGVALAGTTIDSGAALGVLEKAKKVRRE